MSGRLSLDTHASAASDVTGISCRTRDSVAIVDELASILPPGWAVEEEALCVLPDHDDPLPRLRFTHSVLPEGYFVVLGQEYAESSLCYSFHLVHHDKAGVARWRRERRGSGDDDGAAAADYDELFGELYLLSSEDFSELGIDEDKLNNALDVLQPWLETVDDFIVCPLPDLDDVENAEHLPEGSLRMPGDMTRDRGETGRYWFNQRLPFGWVIYESRGVFLYADMNAKRTTNSRAQMRRWAYLDSISSRDELGETEGGWARQATQDFLQGQEHIDGELGLSDDDEDVEELVGSGTLPDGPRNPPPGSAPFDRSDIKEAAVLFHCLLPPGWLMVKNPANNRFVYVKLSEGMSTYTFESVLQFETDTGSQLGFGCGFRESFIDSYFSGDGDDAGGGESEDSSDASGSGDESDGADVGHLNEASQKERRKLICRLGMKRPLGETEEMPPTKKKRIYSLDERKGILQRWDDGHRPRHLKSSVSRWKKRLCRYLPTGNKAKPGLSGTYQFLLVLFKLAYPSATAEEAIVFIAESAPTPKIFSPSQVSEALKRLGMTRKRSSTDAVQAFSETNLMKRHVFWTTPWPTGVQGTARSRFIDADECGIELRDANRKYGHAVANLRVRQPGNYTKSTKLTVLLGIEAGDPSLPDDQEGSVAKPRRYIEVNQKPGTTSADYFDFVTEKILKSFGDNEPQRTLLHDNLSSHLDPALYDSITEAGHRALCRPPWVPSDGPVEWAFNQLGCELRNRSEQINNEDDLIFHIRDILLNLKGMGKLFEKCGY